MQLHNFYAVLTIFLIPSISYASPIIISSAIAPSDGQLVQHGELLYSNNQSVLVQVDTQRYKAMSRIIAAVHPQDELACAINRASPYEASIRDMKSAPKVAIPDIKTPIKAIFSPTGKRLFVQNTHNEFFLVNVETGGIVASNSHIFDSRSLSSAAISNQDTYLAITTSGINGYQDENQYVALYDTRAGLRTPIAKKYFSYKDKTDHPIGELAKDRRGYYEDYVKFAPDSETDLLVAHSDQVQKYSLQPHHLSRVSNFKIEDPKKWTSGNAFFSADGQSIYIQARDQSQEQEYIYTLNKNGRIPSLMVGYIVAGKNGTARFHVEKTENSNLLLIDLVDGVEYTLPCTADVVHFHEASDKVVQIYKDTNGKGGGFIITDLNEVESSHQHHLG